MIHLGFEINSAEAKTNPSTSRRSPAPKETPSSTETTSGVSNSGETSELVHARVLKCTLTEDQLSEVSKAAYAVRQNVPDIREMARASMATIIKDLTGQDADPDELYLNTFSSAVSSTTSFTGVEHTGEPNSSTSLTDLLLANFGANREYLQSSALDAYEGVYTQGRGEGFYGSPNEFKVSASSLRDAIWKADFQSEVLSNLHDFWAGYQDDVALLAKIQFAVAAVTAVGDLKLSLSALIMVMRGAGVNNDPLLAAISNGIGTETEGEDDVEVLTFDINGYASNDILRFVRPNQHTVLYIQGETPSFHEFLSEEALENWVKETAASPQGRKRLEHHFSLVNLQDGFWHTGVANGLKKLGSGAWSTGINSRSTPYTGNLFDAIAENMRLRSLSDADTLITSDSEITLDRWIGNLRGFNRVLWPVMILTPELEFGLLGITMGGELTLEANKAITGDTYDERKAGAVGAMATGSTMLAGAALGSVARNLSEAGQISAEGEDAFASSALRPVAEEQPLRIGDISDFEVESSLIEGRASNQAGIFQAGGRYFIRHHDLTGVPRTYEIRSDFKLRDGYVNVIDPETRKSVAILHGDGNGGWKRITANGAGPDRPPYQGQRADQIRQSLNRRGYYVIADADESAALDQIEAMKERVDALRFKLEDLGREAEKNGRIGTYHLVYRVDNLRPDQLLAAGWFRPSRDFHAVVNMLERPATIGSASLTASNNVLDIWQYDSADGVMYQYAVVTEGRKVGSFVDGGGYDYEFLDEVHFPPPPAKNVYLLDSSDENIRKTIAELAASRSVNTTYGIPLQVYEDFRLGRITLDASPPPELPESSMASGQASDSLKSLDMTKRGQKRTQEWVDGIPTTGTVVEEPQPGPSRSMQHEMPEGIEEPKDVIETNTPSQSPTPPDFQEAIQTRVQKWLNEIWLNNADEPENLTIPDAWLAETQGHAGEEMIRTRFDETSITGTSQSRQQRTSEWVKEYQANNR